MRLKFSFFIDSVPNDKILDLFKLRDIADDKINVTQNLNFTLRKSRNIVRKGENAGNQHCLLFPTMFSKGPILWIVKS